MSNYRSRKLWVFMCLLIGVTTYSFAQPKINSPFSRIGLGDLVNPAFSHARGMGSLGAAYNDPFHINTINPASYAFLGLTAFDVGLNVKRTILSGTEGSQTIYTGNLDYISLAFPTKNPKNRAANPIKSPWYWGMNISFLPFSNVGYRFISQDQTLEGEVINNEFEGNGGTFKVHWGNAVRYNNLSAGFNFGYLFGKVSTDQTNAYQTLESAYFNNFRDEFSIGGIIWNLGLQYRYAFKALKDGEKKSNGKYLTFGVYGNSGNNVDFNASQFKERVNAVYGASSVNPLRDTIVDTQNTQLKGKLPADFGVGIYYEKVNRGGAGIDFKTTAWSNYRNPVRPSEELSNSWRLAAGGNITPDFNSIGSFWKRINYQAGVYYGKDPRSFDKSLTDLGVTFGMRLPVISRQRPPSFINFALEIGQLSGNNTIKETYGKVTVGFTLNNNDWFLKRKFY